MESLGLYLLENCYGTFLCVIIIICFLFGFKNYPKRIVRLFCLLCVLVILENAGTATDRFLSNQPVYSSWRVFALWLSYLAAPAILVNITELMLREASLKSKWLVTIPLFLDILVTSTCFFSSICFSFSQDTNSFIPGTLILVPRLMPLFYLILMLVVAFHNVRRSKAEGIIIIAGVAAVLFDYINEALRIFPVNLREITISITALAYFIYFTTLRHFDEVEKLSETFVENEERFTKEMVDQTIETLAFTIDAKDPYTKGHSFRVAKYSRMIAKVHGKSDAECDQIYRAALLHDIGKISVRANIINKPEELTDEEAETLKYHPERGAKILEKMKSIPYLRDGALYHHEKFDGTGYPAGCKGEEIPELARIISVADAYDAMTSYRSYRPTMDQALVKQEIWKGMGTQFDPHFAKIMISLIDADTNYDLREKPDEEEHIQFETDFTNFGWFKNQPENSGEKVKPKRNGEGTLGEYICTEDHWCKGTEEIAVTNNTVTGSFYSMGNNMEYLWNTPVVIVYSSRDGRLMGPDYDEFGVMVSAGHSWRVGKTLSKTSKYSQKENFINWDNWTERHKSGLAYTVKFHREQNKVFVKLENDLASFDSCFVIPADYEREIYVALTGDKCKLSNIQINI